jgi:hypothetical protein
VRERRAQERVRPPVPLKLTLHGREATLSGQVLELSPLALLVEIEARPELGSQPVDWESATLELSDGLVRLTHLEVRSVLRNRVVVQVWDDDSQARLTIVCDRIRSGATDS